MLTIRQQIALMHRLWPDFDIQIQSDWLVSWKGQLRPFHQTYLVRVFYYLGKYLKDILILPKSPRVMVLEPLLIHRPENSDDPIPHHYPNCANPEHPILCLHDPSKKEWQSDKAIADTILPWTINWLACYEGWQATGKWTGGGRHPT